MPPKPDPCSELSVLIHGIFINLGSRPEIHTVDDIVTEIRKTMPELSRENIVDSVVEATAGHAAERDELTRKLDALRREAKSDKTLRTAIGKLKGNLTTGTAPAKVSRTASKPTEAIASLREQRDELLAAVRNSTPALKQRYEKQIADLTKRIGEGDFAPVARESVPKSKELKRLEYQRDQLRQRIRAQVNAMKPRTRGQKIWNAVSEPLNLTRALVTSGELSAFLRQGKFIIAGHPIRGAQSLPSMLKAAFSEENAYHINEEILNRENAPLYKASGLYLASLDSTAGLTKMEEAYQSKWADKIPGIRASHRAYTVFLNKLRADSFDALAQTMPIAGEPTKVEAEALANFVNVATGRGKIGSEGASAKALSTVFFSPRYLASRFQLLAGQPLYGGNLATRKVIAKEYARFAIGMGVYYALSMLVGGDVEDDPRSSDFGKIRFGDTRIDPLAGLGQIVTLTGRLATGETKTLSGETKDARATDVLARFLRTKLAPIPGAALNIVEGENIVGEKTTAATVARDLLTPITYRDIATSMEEQGVAKGLALALLAFMGEGVQHYHAPTREEIEEKKREQKRAELQKKYGY